MVHIRIFNLAHSIKLNVNLSEFTNLSANSYHMCSHNSLCSINGLSAYIINHYNENHIIPTLQLSDNGFKFMLQI